MAESKEGRGKHDKIVIKYLIKWSIVLSYSSHTENPKIPKSLAELRALKALLIV